jgi:VanZ family protein
MKLAVGYLLAMLALSLVPGTTVEERGSLFEFLAPELQNLLHVPEYALLSWLWCRGLSGLALGTRGSAALALAVAGGCGVVEESIQLLVPGRFGSLTDLALDLVGAVAGVGFFVWRQSVATASGAAR